MENKQAVLYRTLGTATNVLNSELRKTIQSVGAVDTGRMKNTSIVKILWVRGQTNIQLEIDSTEYYKYIDKGTKNLEPRNITSKLLKRRGVMIQLEKVAKALVEYIIWEELGKHNK